MNDQTFDLLKNVLESIDHRLEDIQNDLRDHVAKDEVYWKKIDVQEGQITLLKTIFGSTAFVGFVSGAWAWFTTHMRG